MPELDFLENPAAFKAHFDLPYEDFCQLIEAFKGERAQIYEETLKVNQEAAILWAISEGKRCSIIVVTSDTLTSDPGV